ncbi:MAG: galactose-1-phosphate uridylyltransferase [Myxococcales bacterium]|nr:galactose-1-phosphate uridylyltransferase [Myxococcales bacterium]
MPELRRDPITHRWAIIATERALRPKDYQIEAVAPPEHKSCPFCAGNEHLTPHEIHAVRARGGIADGPEWQIRVVPNKYPALRIEGGLDKRPEGIYDHMNGVGAHEVIIEAPAHDFKLHRLPRAHLVEALEVYRMRMKDLQGDDRFRFSLLFRNHGAAAGASIAHGHAQLIALPVVPQQVRELLDGARRYYEFRDRNVFEDIVRQELDDGQRLIHENADFVLMAPYASRTPFELWIVPRFHAARFESTTRPQLENLAEALATALDRLDVGLGNPAYNFIIQSAPYEHVDVPWYRWHVQVMPKLTRVAGFEWGTGFYINPTAPEEAAEFLRGLRR